VALGILGCAAFSRSTPLVVIALALFLIGIVRSVQFGSFNALTYGDIPPERMSAANSLAQTLQQLSFGVGIAFGALVLHLAQLWNGNRGAVFTAGDFRFAFVVAAALAAVSAFAFRRLAPDAGAEASGHKLKEAVSPAALAG
jgi:hypothetical protein